MALHKHPPEDKVDVRLRLLSAAKDLFSEKGFENASTAEIVRNAGTSESQLNKYFGSKDGLLEAIFLDGWSHLQFVFVAARAATSPSERLRMIFELIIQGFESDPNLMQLLLLEGRRIRKSDHKVILSPGYIRFCACVDKVMAEMLASQHPVPAYSSKAATSALLGLLESLFRDRFLHTQIGYEFAANMSEIRELFALSLRMFGGGPENQLHATSSFE